MFPLMLAKAAANAMLDLRSVGGWLTHRSVAQLACMGLGLLAGILYLQRNDARHDAAKYQKQRDYYVRELQRISSAKDEQGKVTQGNIGKAKDRIVFVDRKAREVEAAPLPGNCRTPDAVRSADL